MGLYCTFEPAHQSLTDAVPGAHAEGYVREALDLVFVLGQETLRPKLLGVGPVLWVAVKAPDGDDDQGPRLQDHVGARNTERGGAC